MNKYYKLKSQSGVILHLTAILLASFIILLGLAVDLSHLSLIKEESRGFARLISLAALDGYWNRPCENLDTCNLEAAVRYSDARRRANEVNKPNKLLAQNKDAALDSVYTESSPGPAGSLSLLPGRWQTKAQNETTCPDNKYPCFVKLNDTSTQLATAFRVQNKTLADYRLPLLSFLMPTVAQINVEVTATLVPRRACFLVDLSMSTVANTHGVIPAQIPAAGLSPLRYEYAYPWQVVDYATKRTEELQIPAKFREAVRSWNLMADVRPATDNDKTIHYKSDYRRYTVVDDSRCPGGVGPECERYVSPNLSTPHTPSISRYTVEDGGDDYFVDVYRSATYYGAEPLRYFLSAISQAIDFLKDRGVPGDMGCIIFFDDRLEWPRILKLSGNFDVLKQAVDSSVIGDLLAAGDQDLSQAVLPPGLLKTIQYRIFPKQARNTDIYLALQEALYQFTSSAQKGIPSADFVVLMSDFIPNCVHTDPANAFNRLDHYEESRLYSPYVNGCINSYQNYRRSAEDIKALARRVFFPASIPIHVLLAGDSLDLHSMDVENANAGDGVCHTDFSMRSAADRRLQFVEQPTPYAYPYYPDGRPVSPKPRLIDIDQRGQVEMDNMYGGSALFSPPVSDSHDIAQMTGGVWLPLRPKGVNCETINYESPRTTCTAVPVKRTTDPWCRSQFQQVQDFMSEIMREHPSVIVEAVAKPRE